MKSIKKSNLNTGDIYALLDTRHQYISRWKSNPSSTLTKGQLKYKTIIKAGELFGLSCAETEMLANRAGLSVSNMIEISGTSLTLYDVLDQSTEFSTELFPYNLSDKPYQKHISVEKSSENYIEGSKYTAFIRHINKILDAYPATMTEIYETALISERMFRYLRNGMHIKKEPILALLIVTGQCLDRIQDCLRKAGFALSKSLPGDAVIIWMLENELYSSQNKNAIYRINDTLYSLGLPLLMTRMRRDVELNALQAVHL